MKKSERCYSCIVDFEYTEHGILCNFLKLKVPEICPCYDCLLISICRLDCSPYNQIQSEFQFYIRMNEELRNETISDLKRKYEQNSLGIQKEN